MGRTLALLVLLAAPGARAADPAVARIAASAQRAQAGDVRARVESYLASIDTPIPDERWRALGPEAGPVLQQIAQDPGRLPTRRARAVSALGIVGGDRSREVALALARDDKEAAIVRTSAVHAAAAMMEGPAAMEALRPLLEHARDPKVRTAAAVALVARAPDLGCGPVHRQLARELPVQRPAFRRALAPCGK